MSDEPTPKNNGGEWSMPEPIFRSSEGHTPKRISRSDQDEVDTESPDIYYADEVDTLSPDFFEADTEIPNAALGADIVDFSELPTEIPNREEDDKTPPAELPKEVLPNADTDPSIMPGNSGGGCFKSVVTIVGVISVFTIMLVVAAVYFLFYFQGTDTSTF